MSDLIKKWGSEILKSGNFRDLDPSAMPLWQSTLNFIGQRQGLAAVPGASQLLVAPEEITGLAQGYVNGMPRIYIGGRTKGWYWTPNTLVNVVDQIGDTGRIRVETFGTWAIFNSGAEWPRLWKNTGDGGMAISLQQMPFSYCKVLKRFMTFVLVGNTSKDHQQLAWCSSDDPEDWDLENPDNTAGDLTLRDLDGEIKGFAGLGSSVAAYSNETLSLVNYLGNNFVIGAQQVLRGIGLWGDQSVVEVDRFNFGFGPQGLFKTDGSGFQILGLDRIKDFVNSEIDKDNAWKAHVWNNELIQSLEFCYPRSDGTWRRLVYNLADDGFWPCDQQVNAAVERQVFAYPIAAKGTDVLAVGQADTWDGLTISGTATARLENFSDGHKSKFLDCINLRGNVSALTLTVLAAENERDTPWTVATFASASEDNWFAVDAFWIGFKLDFSAGSQSIGVTEINLFGAGTGRK